MTMASKEIIQKRLTYYESIYEKLQTAILALVEGGVKSYTIDDRSVNKYDVPRLISQMEDVEQKIDELTAILEGKGPRKAFGIIPRDW